MSTQELSIHQIKPGDKLTDIQFQNGKARKEKEKLRVYNRYRYENGIIILAKDEVADIVFYGCRDTSDFMVVDKIKCGATGNEIFNAYKKENVVVRCTDDVEDRIYEVKNKPLSFVLQKNRVTSIVIYRTYEDRFRPTHQKSCV